MSIELKNKAKRDQELTVSVDFINLVMKAVFRTGLEPEKIYSEIDFDLNILKNPNERIPFTHANYILHEIIKRSPDQNVGLHLGENFDFTMDILHTILFNSPTLVDAIENFCRYSNLLHDACQPIFSVKEDSAVIALKFYTSDIIDYRNFVEGHLSYHYSLLSRLTDGKLKLTQVHFVHPSPSNTTEHERIFGASILFGQKENKLVFNKKFLNLPVFIANPELLKSLEGHAKKLQKEIYSAGSFSSQVESSIMNAFPSEKSDINTLSRQFAMSARNLQNKLQKEGTTYKALLNKVKTKQAKYFLEETDISIIEIAFLLGYSEQSTFSRAFKKLTGSNPGKYRFNYLAKTDSKEM